MSRTILTPEHWAKIRENNQQLRDTIDKIQIEGITAEEYQKKFPRLSSLINLEEVKKMKLVKQVINVPASKVKVKKAAVILIPEGHITPKDLAKELKTSAKALRKVIRKLKLTRTGKCWHWNTTDKEINRIKEAYLVSIQPAAPKPAIKKVAVPAAVEEVEADEEDEDEEAVDEDIPETIIVPPSM